MISEVSGARLWAAVVALGSSLGCPQLAEDQFSILNGSAGVGDNGRGGSSSRAGAGGSAGACVLEGSCMSAGGTSPRDASAPDASILRACASGEREGPSGGCFLAQETERTWQAARDACQALGAGWDLATIRDADDDELVSALVSYEAWLGGTDVAEEGEWLWVTDTSPFYVADDEESALYTNWNAAEPNDVNDSDCLRLLETGLWADLECDELKGYVCGREARP